MTTTTVGPRAVAGFPIFQAVGSGIVCAAYGFHDYAATPALNSKVQLCRLPAGAVVLGGEFFTTDGDTGAEALDMDLGWAANGAEAADPDGFVNGGLLTGDAITDLQAAGFNRRPFITVPGKTQFTRETVVEAKCIAEATTFQAFSIACVVYYVVP